MYGGGSLNVTGNQPSSVESSRAASFQILQKQLMTSISQHQLQQQQQKMGANLLTSQLTRTVPATTLSLATDVPSSGSLLMEFDTDTVLPQQQQSVSHDSRDVKAEIKTEVETFGEMKCEMANEIRSDVDAMKMEGGMEETSGSQLDNSIDGTKAEADVTPPAAPNPINKKCK